MEFWVSGFRRDAHPSQEVAIWERLAAAYLEYIGMVPRLNPEQKQRVYQILLHISTTGDKQAIKDGAASLPNNAFELSDKIYHNAQPPFDFAEEMPKEEQEAEKLWTGFEAEEFARGVDRETFPKDLPDQLIRDLMKDPSQ
jgi:hypothetical protein